MLVLTLTMSVHSLILQDTREQEEESLMTKLLYGRSPRWDSCPRTRARMEIPEQLAGAPCWGQSVSCSSSHVAPGLIAVFYCGSISLQLFKIYFFLEFRLTSMRASASITPLP